MTLRCRPGELAVIVWTAPQFLRFLGRIVKVTSLARDCPVPAWHTEPPLTGPAGGVILADDACLRPIRPDADPVDVERDEPVEAPTC